MYSFIVGNLYAQEDILYLNLFTKRKIRSVLLQFTGL